MIQWKKLTKEEIAKIDKIADRAMADFKSLQVADYPRVDLVMDLSAAHLDIPMDLDKFLTFDDFNFRHDVSGIRHCINRISGKIDNCFVPRCAR